jgi:hypothetical protein
MAYPVYIRKQKEQLMPKGIPRNGVRMTKKRVASGMFNETGMVQIHRKEPVVEVVKETDTQIEARLRDRFNILGELTEAALNGDARAVIVSGPAGLGKSFTVEEKLREWDPEQLDHTIVKGYVKPTGLLRLLYRYRNEGQVIVFDDADTVFFDDTCLNLLKAVCDTTDIRRVSYLAEVNMVDEESGDQIPRNFDFDGTIIFITNLDMDSMIDRGHKLAPHLSALVSRSHYIDLTMKTKRDYLVRIKQVVKDGMLRMHGLDSSEEEEVMNFIHENQDRLRELSLRIAVKISNLVKMGKPDWKRIAQVTCCRN